MWDTMVYVRIMTYLATPHGALGMLLGSQLGRSGNAHGISGGHLLGDRLCIRLHVSTEKLALITS